MVLTCQAHDILTKTMQTSVFVLSKIESCAVNFSQMSLKYKEEALHFITSIPPYFITSFVCLYLHLCVVVGNFPGFRPKWVTLGVLDNLTCFHYVGYFVHFLNGKENDLLKLITKEVLPSREWHCCHKEFPSCSDTSCPWNILSSADWQR